MAAASLRRGLLAAGNFIVDHIKIVDAYPREEMLAHIFRETRSNGGGPYNVLKDLAKMGAPFPLAAAGLIGEDAAGDWVSADAENHGIDCQRLRRTKAAPTSYTDAFTVESTGRRTFFHQTGANAILDEHHFDLVGTEARIFYLGYLMLLPALDHVDEHGGTGAARVLLRARASGMRTVADLVSVQEADFAASVSASLPHLDALLLNELEAQKLTGHIIRRPDGGLAWDLAEAAARELLGRGIRTAVIMHFVEGALLMTSGGDIVKQGSVQLPEGFSRGATGAGDAFAAGFLWGWHEDAPWAECLKIAVCAAAMNLSDPSTSEGLQPLTDCLALGARHGFRPTA